MQKHHHSPLMAATTTLECEGALSDLILQAARQAVPAGVDSLLTLPDVGARNQPLMPLLVGLIDAAKVTANAIADNAWDSGVAVPEDLATDLIVDLERCTQYVRQATEAF
jgi:hypothetical protein